jgi:hypothetical protein
VFVEISVQIEEECILNFWTEYLTENIWTIWLRRGAALQLESLVVAHPNASEVLNVVSDGQKRLFA